MFKIVNKQKISDLAERITEGATSDSIALSEVLRLCMRLGKQLKNDKLTLWARSELDGYSSVTDLPDYRILPGAVLADFSGPFGSGLRNAQVPKFSVDKDDRDWLFSNKMLQPVAELERLTKGKESETLKSPWPADVVAYYQRKEIYEGMVLVSAWRTLTKPSLIGILDTIRTRVLDFILQIEDEIDFENSSDSSESVKKNSKKITQIVNNTIYGGNVSVGNFGATTQNNIQIKPGDLNSLKEYLSSLGLTRELIQDLEKSLADDEKSKVQPGPKTQSWLSRIMIMIGRGSLDLATNAGGSLIASALMKYLGISN